MRTKAFVISDSEGPVVKFVATRINYDDNTKIPWESRYAVPVSEIQYQRYVDDYQRTRRGGDGFHEGLNFYKGDNGLVLMYLPPGPHPKDMDEEYVFFSFTYSKHRSVLGVHGSARIISKEGIVRPTHGRLKLKYHIEADSHFVTLFSGALDFDWESGRYMEREKAKNWGSGFRYLDGRHAVNILKDALAKAREDQKTGTVPYRNFVSSGIEVINRLLARYGSDLEADIEDEDAAAAERTLARSWGQGFAGTPQQRKALEMHAMDAAEAHFRKQGYTVKNVSRQKPYDLLCTRSDTELYVEVKGTTTAGDKIMLTCGEVRHACNESYSCALFLLHSIQLNGEAASGGVEMVFDPWRPKNDLLSPICYTYNLSATID